MPVMQGAGSGPPAALAAAAAAAGAARATTAAGFAAMRPPAKVALTQRPEVARCTAGDPCGSGCCPFQSGGPRLCTAAHLH